MILAVCNTKGGVGKTTLAVNLAIGLALKGADVLLVDGDQQRTAIEFTELREDLRPGRVGYTAVELGGAAIRTQCRALKAKYSEIVIDVGGRDSGSLRAALTVADLVLVPVQPRSFDLWAMDQMAELITEAREINDRLRAVAVLSQADPQGRDNGEAATYIEKVPGMELAPSRIVRRKVYPNAASLGESIFELNDPQQREAIEKARQDMGGLMEWLYASVTTR